MRQIEESGIVERAALSERIREFNGRVEKAREWHDDLLARLRQMADTIPGYSPVRGESEADRLRKDTKARVLQVIERFEQDYRREGARIDAADERKYALIGNLEHILIRYQEATEKFAKEMRATALQNRAGTDAALSQFGNFSNAIRRDRAVIQAQTEVDQAVGAKNKAEDDEVRNGVATLRTEVATAKTAAETAKTAAETAKKTLADAKELEKAQPELEKQIKDMKEEREKLEKADIPEKKDVVAKAERDVLTAGVAAPLPVDIPTAITKLIEENTKEKEKVDRKEGPYSTFTTVQQTTKKAELDAALVKKRTALEALQKARGELEDLTKKTAEPDGPLRPGLISKLEAEMAENKRRIDTIPTLEKAVNEADENVKTKEQHATETKKRYEELSADLVEKEKPKKEAEKQLSDAQAKLTAARTLAATRIPGSEDNRRYRDVAFGTVHQIDEEGRHLWRHFRNSNSVTAEGGESIDDVKGRMKILLQRKSQVLLMVLKTELKKPENLADISDLPANSSTLRFALSALRSELQFLQDNGAEPEARITEITEIVTHLTAKLRAMLTRETDEALLTTSTLKPEEKYAAVQREIAYLSLHHEGDPAADARIKDLGGETGYEGKLKDVLAAMHQPSFAATETVIGSVRLANCNTLPTDQLPKAIAAVRAEVAFLRKYPYAPDRLAQLKTDWENLKRVEVERRTGTLVQDAEKALGVAGKVGGEKRFAAITALEKQARDRIARGGGEDAVRELKSQRDNQVAQVVTEADTAARRALLSRVPADLTSAADKTAHALEFLVRTEGRATPVQKAELAAHLPALRRALAEVNDATIRQALDPKAEPVVVLAAYTCIRDEMRLLRTNSGYRSDFHVPGRLRDLSISLSQVVVRVGREIEGAFGDYRNDRSIDQQRVDRALALIPVERTFRTQMEMETCPGMPEPNTFWLARLNEMEAVLKNATQPLREEEQAVKVVALTQLAKIGRQLDTVQSEADIARARTYLEWLQQQEAFFMDVAEKNPTVAQPYLKRIGEQLWRVRTFEERRDALARDLAVISQKANMQSWKIKQAYSRFIVPDRSTPLAQKRELLSKLVQEGGALLDPAQAQLAFAKQDHWQTQIDVTAIEAAVQELDAQVRFGQSVLSGGLAGGANVPPPPPPLAPTNRSV